MASSPTPIDVVLQKEIETIHARRRAAGSKEYQPNSETPVTLEDTSESLVGLALSGGGVRSGAFNLGMIQALYSAGRMRAIDFISTVSGGGYAGALFSAEVAKPNTKNINWLRRNDPMDMDVEGELDSQNGNGQLIKSSTDRLEIEPNLDGSQPPRVKQLALYGRMMGDFVKLLSRHLAGFLITLAFLISGVIACASILAIIMRLPYNRSVLTHLDVLKFSTDLSVPMFPAFIAFCIWLACLAIGRTARLMGNPVPSIVKSSYVLLMATTLLGALAFLAIGDVDINSWTRRFNINMPVELQESLTNWIGWIGTFLTGLFVTMLLPVLAPRRLLESGADSTNPFKRFVFNISGWALVVGVPLFLYFLLVHENISGHMMERHDADRFTESHVVDIDKLLLRLKAQERIGGNRAAIANNLHSPFVDPAKQEQKNVAKDNTGNKRGPTGKFDYKADVNEFLTSIETRNKNEAKTGFFSAWGQAIASPVLDEYGNKVEAIRKYDKYQWKMVNILTDECLSDPWLISLPDSIETSSNSATGAPGDVPSAEASGKEALRILGIVDGTNEKERRRYKQILTAYQRMVDAREYVERVLNKPGEPQRTSDDEKEETAKKSNNEPARTWSELCQLQDKLNDPKTSAKLAKFNDPFEGNLKNVVSQVRTSNWVLLNALYPEHFRPQNTTFAFAVNESDQKTRGNIAIWAIIIFVVTGLITNLNRTNLHGVYRDQLATTWLPEADIRLSDLDTCSKGAPLQLIQCTLNRMGTRSDPDAERKSRFCMSYLYCGSNKVGYRPTKFYQDGRLSVADAIAISGAAVSPINSAGMLARVLLVVTNFRTGQWVLNPAELKNDQYWPSPILTMLNWMRYPEQRKYLFVSDGGHLENTGIAALLQRRCRLIIFGDASFDEDYKFTDVLMLLQDARAKYGIRVTDMFDGNTDSTNESTTEKDPNPESRFAALRPNDDGFSKSHFIVIEIQYPVDERDNCGEPLTGLIILCKSSLTGDEVPELVELADKENSFPHDLTSDQFLDSDRFEAYLELGRHIGECVDDFVCAGHLDKYKLPLGWHSDSIAPGVEPSKGTDPRDSKENNSETSKDKNLARNGSQASKETWQKYPFLRTLEKLNFDSKGISKSLAHFEKLLDEHESKKAHGAIDSSEFEALSSWARERGMNSSKELRKQMCDGLGGMIKKHISTIVDSPITHLSFFQMLESLGTRVPGVSASLKLLAAPIEE